MGMGVVVVLLLLMWRVCATSVCLRVRPRAHESRTSMSAAVDDTSMNE